MKIREIARSPIGLGLLFGVFATVAFLLLTGRWDFAPEHTEPEPTLGDSKPDASEPTLATSGQAVAPSAAAPVWPIKLQVQDEDGESIAHAFSYYLHTGGSGFRDRESTATMPSGEAGTVELTRPPDDVDTLAIVATGYVPSAVPIEALLSESKKDPGTTLIQKLRRGGTVTGRVHDPQGNPIPGADVFGLGRRGSDHLATDPSTIPDLDHLGALLQTKTGPEGRFELSGISVFPIALQVNHPLCVHYHGGVLPRATRDGQDIEIQLERFGCVDLRFRDSVTNEPIHTAAVGFSTAMAAVGPVVGPEKAGVELSGWTKAGTFRQFFLMSEEGSGPDGFPYANVSAPGFRPARIKLDQLRFLELTGPIEPPLMDIALTKEDGAPLGRVRVEVVMQGSDRPPRVVVLGIRKTEGRGASAASWSIKMRLKPDKYDAAVGVASALLPEGVYEATASIHVGFWSPETSIGRVVVDAASAAVVRVKAPLAPLRVAAKDAAGKAIHDFRVTINRIPDSQRGLKSDSKDPPAPVLMMESLWWRRLPDYEEGRLLSPQGPYIGDLWFTQGRYVVIVSKPGFQSTAELVELKAGAPPFKVVATLQSLE